MHKSVPVPFNGSVPDLLPFNLKNSSKKFAFSFLFKDFMRNWNAIKLLLTSGKSAETLTDTGLKKIYS